MKNTQVGQASPNPSYPQEIKYVRGKNIYDKSKVYRPIATQQNVNNDFENLEQGELYTFSTGNHTWATVLTYDSANNRIRTLGNTATSKEVQFTPTSQEVKFVTSFYVGGSVETKDVDFTGVQLEKGSATSYLPYNTIEEVVSGKNEIPFPYYDSDVQDRNGVNWSVNENGTINASGTANSSSSIFYICNGDDDLYLDPGTYKISSNFSGAQFSWQVIQIVNGSYGTVYWDNMVLTERTRLRVRVIAKPNTEVSASNCYLMIERGNTATTYEPYITPKTYQLSLGDIELNAIGNYKDELVYDVENDKVYKKAYIGKITLNGSENWVNGTTNSRFYSTTAITDYNISNRASALCSHYKYNGTPYFALSGSGNYLFFGYPNSSVNSLSAWGSWLSTNKTYVLYVLETSTDTEITDTTLINQVKALYNAHSLNGTTIITSNGNLPMIIKVRGLKGE